MNNATKTISHILRDNICSFFNLLNFLVLCSLVAVGAWKNTPFFLVIVLNTAIGITQEIKAKRQVERLSLLTQPAVTMLVGGKEKTARAEDVQKGDLLLFAAGSVVCTDCLVKEGRLEVSEAILTGESEAVIKLPGDELLSGSSVISGKCRAEALCPATDCAAAKMVEEVKKSKGSSSELLSSMRRVTKFTGFFIIPLGAALFLQAVLFRSATVDTAVVATAAGLLGMLPKGLVLLISIGLAVGVIRLSKQNVLVRDLYSLENLAHCDIICLDKTGTLTEGSLVVERVDLKAEEREFRKLMATYLAYTEDNNATYSALLFAFCQAAADTYEVSGTEPFSSERKYSSVTLADGRRFIIGAPEKLCKDISPEVKSIMSQGRRVLLASVCGAGCRAEDSEVIAVLIIADKLRKNASQTIGYFYRQDMDVKVISGDSPLAAAAVAKSCGIRNTENCIDASTLSDGELAKASETHTVFGRVSPEQKKILVSALQEKGHRIAMTGDGVNDLLALRQADCSIAMGGGSDAAKQIGQLVLLDSDFAVLRNVIAEGRRVVNNLTKSAGVFFIKTIYSILLCILCLVLNRDFPFIPIQITLIDAAIEAFPAFFMSFEENDRKIEGTFLCSALCAALPNSLAIFLCCAAVYIFAPAMGIASSQIGLLLYLTVGIISLAGVFKASLPFNALRAFLSAASAAMFFCSAAIFAPLLQLPLLTARSAFFLSLIGVPGVLLAAAPMPLFFSKTSQKLHLERTHLNG